MYVWYNKTRPGIQYLRGRSRYYFYQIASDKILPFANEIVKPQKRRIINYHIRALNQSKNSNICNVNN